MEPVLEQFCRLARSEFGLRVRVIRSRQNPLDFDFKAKPERKPGEPYWLGRHEFEGQPWVFLAGPALLPGTEDSSRVLDLAHRHFVRIVTMGVGRAE